MRPLLRLKIPSDTTIFVLVLCAALLLRLPLITLGYGTDPDAYRAVLAAERLASGAGYSTSRLPGYPVHEFLLYASRVYQTPFGANALSLLAFGLTGLFLFLVLRSVRPATSLPYSIVFLAAPIGLIPSSEAMDYSLSLLLLVVAIYLILKSRRSTGAFLLGAATASRITNGAAIIAVLPFVFRGMGPWQVKRYFWFLLSFIVGWLFFFSPILLTFGFDFFTFYDNNERRPLVEIVKMGMGGTWGYFGSIAVGLCVMLAIVSALRAPERLKSREVQTGLALVALYWIAFFRLPLEVQYLLPAVVGFLIALSGLIARRMVAWILAIAVIVSSINPAISYYERRETRAEVVACIVSRLHSLPSEANLIVPTTMERAYFAQGVFRDRPDLEFLVNGRDDFPQASGPVYATDGSIFDKPAATCSVPIVQVHPSQARG